MSQQAKVLPPFAITSDDPIGPDVLLPRGATGKVEEITAPGGAAIPVDDVIAKVKAVKPAVLFLCQGESSTGVQQSLAGLSVCQTTLSDNKSRLLCQTAMSDSLNFA